MKNIFASTLILMTALPVLSVADPANFDIISFAKPDKGSGGGGKGKNGGGGEEPPAPPPSVLFWMNEEIGDAWSNGFLGQGASITVIDDFNSGDVFGGNLTGHSEVQTHGGWTYSQSSLVAPEANVYAKDFSSGRSVRLRSGLNIMNMSYGMYAEDGYDKNQIRWGKQETSLIDYAFSGQALLSKAAGNDAIAVDTANLDGYKDYLASALVGAPSAIFVGALSTNGSISSPASLAWYSNYAGENPVVQDQFIVVGVEGDLTGLYGTSFAAPIISGYAAILGSKFDNATPTAVARQLLNTARQDTILNYNVNMHGKGEASISRALAPVIIN